MYFSLRKSTLCYISPKRDLQMSLAFNRLKFFQTYDPTYSTRLIHVFSSFWPDLFMFFQSLGPAYSTRLTHVFSNFWLDLFHKTYSCFFQTFGPTYSTRLIHVFFKLWPGLFTFFQTFGPTYSYLIKNDNCNLIFAV